MHIRRTIGEPHISKINISRIYCYSNKSAHLPFKIFFSLKKIGKNFFLNISMNKNNFFNCITSINRGRVRDCIMFK